MLEGVIASMLLNLTAQGRLILSESVFLVLLEVLYQN